MVQSNEDQTTMRQLVLNAARSIGATGGAARTAPRVLANLCGQSAQPAQISEIIAGDPGLSVRVLKVANSAYYGLSHTVSTIERAIIVLGRDAVRGIAAAACLDRTLSHGDTSGVDVDALLRHSLATAAAAQSLALLRHAPLAGDAFMAGLLHDLGISIQLRLDPRRVGEFFHRLKANTGQLTMAEVLTLEEEIVGFSHHEAASIAFEDWKLPPWLVNVTAHHHAPLAAASENRILACIVHLADQLSPAADPAYIGEAPATAPAAEILALTGLHADNLDVVRTGLSDSVVELHRALFA